MRLINGYNTSIDLTSIDTKMIDSDGVPSEHQLQSPTNGPSGIFAHSTIEIVLFVD